MYKGGDGYNSFKKGKLVIAPLHQMELVAVAYLRKLRRINVVVEDQINSVPCSKELDNNFFTQSGVAGC